MPARSAGDINMRLKMYFVGHSKNIHQTKHWALYN